VLSAGASRGVPRAVAVMAPHEFVEEETLAGIRVAREAWATSDLPAKLGRYHPDVQRVFFDWNDTWLSPAFRAWNIEEYLPRIHCPVLALQGGALRSGAAVFHTVLIHLENGVPIQYEDRYVNPAAAPDYLTLDFTQTTPTHHLLAHAPLTEASYSIEACLPSAAEAKQLGIKRSEPCLVMMRRTVSGAHVASVARLVYPGTRYSFAGQFQA